MTVILKHMSTTVDRVSAALGYDVPCQMLAAKDQHGELVHSFEEVLAFAVQLACLVDLTDQAPESARTILATNMPTVCPKAA